jgi:hypothetical protein
VKRNLLLISLCLFGISLGFAVVLGWRVATVQKAQKAAFSPQPLTLDFQPPAQSRTGKISAVQGSVLKNTRDDKELKPLQDPLELKKGETMKTEKNATATVVFSQITTVVLNQNSEASLISALPSSFLVKQNSGSIHYETIATHPISIHTHENLVLLQDGNLQITAEADRVTLNLEHGHGKFSFINPQNETQVYELTASRAATIHDQTKVVTYSVK